MKDWVRIALGCRTTTRSWGKPSQGWPVCGLKRYGWLVFGSAPQEATTVWGDGGAPGGRRAIGAEAPFRLTATLTDGTHIYAVRYSTDEAPPSLYWSRENGHLLVVSEPFEEETERAWNEVPPNQLLVYERGGAIDMVPFIPG